MKRRNFTTAVRVEIVKRASVEFGMPTCEAIEGPNRTRCPATKGLEIHHVVMDAMEIDKSRKLTAADGMLLCPGHHDPITRQQMKALSKARACEAAHLGAKRPTSRKIPSRPKAPKPEPRPIAFGMPEIARRMMREDA